jgi:hypothetical protein
MAGNKLESTANIRRSSLVLWRIHIGFTGPNIVSVLRTKKSREIKLCITMQCKIFCFPMRIWRLED